MLTFSSVLTLDDTGTSLYIERAPWLNFQFLNHFLGSWIKSGLKTTEKHHHQSLSRRGTHKATEAQTTDKPE